MNVVELSKVVSQSSKVSNIIGQLGKDCVFGQLSFFSGYIRQAQAKAKSFTTILKISRTQFLDIVQKNEKELQQLCFMKDSILNYRNYETIQQKCPICNKYSHFSTECPIVHFDRDEAYKKVQFFEKIQQKRVMRDRRNFKLKNTIKGSFQSSHDEFIKHTLLEPISYLTNISREGISDDEYDDDGNILLKSVCLEECKPSKQKVKSLTHTDSNILQHEVSNAGQEEIFKHKLIDQVAFQKLSRTVYTITDNHTLSNDDQPSCYKPSSDVLLQESSFVKANEEIMQQKSVNVSHFINMVTQILHSSLNKTQRHKLKKPEDIMENSKENQKMNAQEEKKTEAERINYNDKMMWRFDVQKDFGYYFPDGNISNSLQSYNRYIRQKQRKKLYNKKQFEKNY